MDMPLPRLARYLVLGAFLATIVISWAGSSTDVRAATTVATLVSGGSGVPGNNDPAVEFLNAANTWVPAVIVAPNALYAPALAGSQYIDAPGTAAAPSPNPVVMRTAFKLPTGCVGPAISISLHADNWADVYLNGPPPSPLPAAANTFGGQPHAAIFANFQGPPSVFATAAPALFVNPGANWLYIVLENAGPVSPNDPRALDFSATVTCDRIVTVPPPTLVYECFQLDQGQDPVKPVMLDTANFGKDVVSVRVSDLMCETAFKYRQVVPGTVPAPPPVKEALQCFRLQKGQDPDDPAILDTSNFGPDKVRVRVSTRMCETAIKLRPQMPPFGDVKPQVWQCFNLRDGDNPNVPVVLATNNFGPHRAFVGRAVMMCETAAKYVLDAAGNVVLSIPNDTKQVYECFRLNEAPNQALPATLITRNFGPDDVRIRRANLMCEPAKKTILFENPDPNEPIPDGLDD